MWRLRIVRGMGGGGSFCLRGGQSKPTLLVPSLNGASAAFLRYADFTPEDYQLMAKVKLVTIQPHTPQIPGAAAACHCIFCIWSLSE